MTTQNKEMVIGDVVKWEMPHELARTKIHITVIPGATLPLVVGELLEPGGAVAQIHTFDTKGNTADGGTFKLGYKGQWTAAQAWNETLGNLKTAFEALSTVTDTVTFSAAFGNTVTMTWATAGKKSKVNVDGRLLLDTAVVMDDATLDVTTGGSTAALSAIILATGANADYILLEKVILADLQTELNIERTVIKSGECIVNGNNLYAIAAEIAAGKTAMIARGVTVRTEPTIFQSGIPTS